MLKQTIQHIGINFVLALLLKGITGCSVGIGNEGLGSFPGKSMTIMATDTSWTENIDVVLPQSTADLIACIDCHKGLKVNTQKRVLTSTHEKFVFDHPGFDREISWCYYCHQTVAFDKLRLKDDSSITYQQSYGLCVQCHIKKYREWEVGIHGKRTGEWNGVKQHMSCVYCHNAHSPKIKPLEPMKPPIPPNKYRANLNF